MYIAVWAYLDNNIGDDLMIKLLAENFNDKTFILYSDKSVVSNTFSSINNIEIRPTCEMNSDLNSISMFLSIGGSIFNNLNSIKGKLARLKRILLISKLKRNKIKIATIGCNLGPYNDKLGLILTKIELKMNDLVTVRDKYSFELLKEFKTIKNYHVANDIVYLLKKQNNDKLGQTTLGLTAYRSLAQNERNFENYTALTQIIDSYIDKTNNDVKIFAFDSESENDLSAAHHICHLSKFKNKVHIVPYLGNIEEFLKEFSTCSESIAIRFHGAILSDIMNIPFLPVIYSNKMSNLLDDNNFDGERLFLSDLKPENIDVNHIVEQIISKEGMVTRFQPYNNSILHFEELSKIIDSI